MEGRERSGTYSSLCETEIDFIPPVRNNSICDFAELSGVELDNALLKDSKPVIKSPSPVADIVVTEIIAKPKLEIYSSFQKRLSSEILGKLESSIESTSEITQSEVIEGVLINVSSYVDMKLLTKLNNPNLSANSLYGEISSEYISKELLRGSKRMRNRLLSIANTLSSHKFFDPIFCQLTLTFVYNYIHRTLQDTDEIDESIEMHNLFLLCLNSVFKGSNRLFMFDLNNHQTKFSHLYEAVKTCLLVCSQDMFCCQNYLETPMKPFTSEDIIKTTGEITDDTLSESSGTSEAEEVDACINISHEEWISMIHNHRMLIHVFLSDMLTIVGKYSVYFEGLSSMSALLIEVDNKCGILDLKQYKKASSIILLYTILVVQSIRSEETLVIYMKNMRQFKDITQSFDLSVRMQSVLQRLSTSGGPLFPTEEVRKEARITTYTLYPSGRFPRWFVHFLFGFLHPYYMHLWFLRQIKSIIRMGFDGIRNYIYLCFHIFLTIYSSLFRYWVDVWNMLCEYFVKKLWGTKNE